MWTRIFDSMIFTCLRVVLWLDWHLGLFETWLNDFMIDNPWNVFLSFDWWNLRLRLLYVFLEISRIKLIYQYILSLNLWLDYSLNTFYVSSIYLYVYNILNLCFMIMIYSSVICVNGTMSFCVRCFHML